MRAGGLQSAWRFDWLAPKLRKGQRGVAANWLVALALLAQLLVPASHYHSADRSAQPSVEANAGDSSFSAAASVPCAQHAAKANGSDHPSPAPCQNDCCQSGCCHLMGSSILIPPTGMAAMAYAPLLAETIAASQTPGSITFPAAFAGRPRGPPVLI